MKKIWFRVGMEAEVTDEELKELKMENVDMSLWRKLFLPQSYLVEHTFLEKIVVVLMIMIIQKKKLTFYFRRY